MPLREEVLPIHDIRVSFRGYAIARAHLEPEGEVLALRQTDDGFEVTVPRLNLHSMVIAELK